MKNGKKLALFISLVVFLMMSFSFVKKWTWKMSDTWYPTPPDYEAVIQLVENDKLIQISVLNNIDKLSQKGYAVKEDEHIIFITKGDLKLQVLKRNVDKFSDVNYSYDRIRTGGIALYSFYYNGNGISYDITYSTSVFNRESVVLNYIKQLYADLKV